MMQCACTAAWIQAGAGLEALGVLLSCCVRCHYVCKQQKVEAGEIDDAERMRGRLEV